MSKSDLPARLRALAASLEGDEWEHPITAQHDCLAAADELERLATSDTPWEQISKILDDGRTLEIGRSVMPDGQAYVAVAVPSGFEGPIPPDWLARHPTAQGAVDQLAKTWRDTPATFRWLDED